MVRYLYAINLGIAFFLLLLTMMMVNVVQCSTIAQDVNYELRNSRTFLERVKTAIRYANTIDKPNYRHLASDKANYLAQVRARIKMAQSAYDGLIKLHTTKIGAISGDLKVEFHPQDREEAKGLLEKFSDSDVWLRVFLWLFKEEVQFFKFRNKLAKCEKILQESNAKLEQSPKLARRKVVLDKLETRLELAKQILDNFAPILTREINSIKANVVNRGFFDKFNADKSEYNAKSSQINDLEYDCGELPYQVADWPLLVESDNDLSDREMPQDDPKVKHAKIELRNQRKLRNDQSDKLEGIMQVLFGGFSVNVRKKARVQLIETRDTLKKAWSGVQEAKRKVKEAKQSSKVIQPRPTNLLLQWPLPKLNSPPLGSPTKMGQFNRPQTSLSQKAGFVQEQVRKVNKFIGDENNGNIPRSKSPPKGAPSKGNFSPFNRPQASLSRKGGFVQEQVRKMNKFIAQAEESKHKAQQAKVKKSFSGGSNRNIDDIPWTSSI